MADLTEDQCDHIALAANKLEQHDSGYSIDVKIAVTKIFRKFFELGAPDNLQSEVLELADAILAAPLVTA
ncbi:hypothetical protein [Salinibacterium sp.]|uniref:hypothetical protein n=1 Tax=Salinibacterium sp. TaxID=1915057 RepID=UPI00286C0936|nr:hypothetical protein [Salinibacterium sp.]